LIKVLRTLINVNYTQNFGIYLTENILFLH